MSQACDLFEHLSLVFTHLRELFATSIHLPLGHLENYPVFTPAVTPNTTNALQPVPLGMCACVCLREVNYFPLLETHPIPAELLLNFLYTFASFLSIPVDMNSLDFHFISALTHLPNCASNA